MIPTASASLVADPVLFGSVTDAVDQALTMCDAAARCVGLASVPGRDPGRVTGLIGVHGNVSGFITLNLAERAALSMISGLLQDRCNALSAQVIDGVGELANIVAGGIKKRLIGTPWCFSHVTVPSVIIGQNYQIAYAQGLQYLCVTFEHKTDDALLLEDRLFQVAVSLLRL